jgi:hypothetical protein
MHFAEINSENIVQRVIVADQDYIDSGVVGDTSNWIQTSYNTRGGKHYPPDSDTSDGDGLRKNYASKGSMYDASRDAFYAPQPYPSWTLDDDTCQWNAPTAMPDDDKRYYWDEDNTKWVETPT